MAEPRTVPEEPTVPPLGRRLRHPRRRVVVVGVAAVVGAVVVALFAYSTEHTFSVRSDNVGDLMQPTCAGVQFPAGASVYFHWSASAATRLVIGPCTNDSVTVYSGSGSSGSGSFTANGGLYWFGMWCGGIGDCSPPANVTGTYWAPWI